MKFRGGRGGLEIGLLLQRIESQGNTVGLSKMLSIPVEKVGFNLFGAVNCSPAGTFFGGSVWVGRNLNSGKATFLAKTSGLFTPSKDSSRILALL